MEVNWDLILGPFGLTVVLFLFSVAMARVVLALVKLHLKEDDARDKRLASGEAREDILAKAVEQAAGLIKEIREELVQLRKEAEEHRRQEEIDRLQRQLDQQAYRGPERRGRERP